MRICKNNERASRNAWARSGHPSLLGGGTCPQSRRASHSHPLCGVFAPSHSRFPAVSGYFRWFPASSGSRQSTLGRRDERDQRSDGDGWDGRPMPSAGTTLASVRSVHPARAGLPLCSSLAPASLRSQWPSVVSPSPRDFPSFPAISRHFRRFPVISCWPPALLFPSSLLPLPPPSLAPASLRSQQLSVFNFPLFLLPVWRWAEMVSRGD